MSVLHLNVKSLSRQEDAGCMDLDDQNRHQEENVLNEKVSAEHTEVFQCPLKWSERIKRTPVLFSGTMKGAVKEPLTYVEPAKGSEKNKCELTLKEELHFIGRNNTSTETFSLAGEDGLPWKLLFKQKLDEQVRIAPYKVRLVKMHYVYSNSVHYDGTFAPVISFDVSILVVGKVTSVCWHVHHADIYTAFPNTDIEVQRDVQIDDKSYKNRRVNIVQRTPRMSGMRSWKYSEIVWIRAARIVRLCFQIWI